MCIVYALNEPQHRKPINELKNTHKQHSADEQQHWGKKRTYSNLTGGEVGASRHRGATEDEKGGKWCGQGEEAKIKKKKKSRSTNSHDRLWSN